MSEISTLFCGHCKTPFQPTNKRQRFCKDTCRAAAHYAPTKATNEAKSRENFRRRRRHKSLGFDGRYGGPVNPHLHDKPVDRE
jgi:hypothetical protein